MSKYNVGDKFVFEIKGYNGENLYLDGEGNYYTEQYLDRCEKIKDSFSVLEYEKVRQAIVEEGIEEAWNLAKAITLSGCEGGMQDEDIDEIFGNTAYYSDIFSLSFHEAKEKIEAWKRKQEIHEGDVVEILGAAAVVLAIDNEIATMYMLDDEYAKLQEVPLHQLKKTGSSIDVMKVLSKALIHAEAHRLREAKGSAE